VVFRSNMLRVAAAAALLTMASLSSVAQTPSEPHRVALAPDTCPVVHPGDIVMLDWNPGYAPAWPVTSIDWFSLRMRRADYVRHGLLEPAILLAPSLPLHPVAPGPNGIFHFEMLVKPQHRISGEYYVFNMQARPQLAPDYRGEAPAVTNSAADARLCINFENTDSRVPPSS
jgi:hypothetical protein